MSGWQPIDENTPREPGKAIVCWREGWSVPVMLMWKTNRRIVQARERGQDVGDFADSYFGDLGEYDDYEFTQPDGGPTYWHPLEPLPCPC